MQGQIRSLRLQICVSAEVSIYLLVNQALEMLRFFSIFPSNFVGTTFVVICISPRTILKHTFFPEKALLTFCHVL